MRRTVLLAVVMLSLVAPVRGEDFPQYKTADELWGHIQELVRQPPSPDHAQMTGQLEKLHGTTVEFENRYANDPRRWGAKLIRIQVESVRAQIEQRQPDNEALFAMIRNIIAAEDASPAMKADARYVATTARLQALESGASTNAAALSAAKASVAELSKQYPDDPRTAVAQYELAQFLKVGDPDAAESILRELAGSKNIQIAAMARQQLDSVKTLRKLAKGPLDLKFRAVDGAQVDLAKLRGKVVLLDFWATWCGPCRMEIPNVVATYNRFHKDGFEIVGVSLDRDKEKLLAFTKQAGMTWPQYFDGKTWANEISTRYGINSIPAAWLVDKKGVVRSTEARGADLAKQVGTLLAE